MADRSYGIRPMAPCHKCVYSFHRISRRRFAAYLHMLTTAQKAAILQKTGAAVPEAAADATAEAASEWSATVNMLFVSYVAARAAKSLRDAEEARQLGVLRQMSAISGRTIQAANRA